MTHLTQATPPHEKTINKMDANLGQIELVKNINLDDSSFPANFIEFGDQLYFSANDSENGRELWVSDGTQEGTQLLADINPGSEGSSFFDNLVINDKFYFSASGENGRELYVSDGTTEGTQLVADLLPGENSFGSVYGSSPHDFVEFNNQLYFSASNDADGDRKLFATDGLPSNGGTAEGTKLIADIDFGSDGIYTRGSRRDIIKFDNQLYFTADDGENGRELWVSDGTIEGTQLLIDINTGEPYYTRGPSYPASSSPRDFIEFNDKLYFTADDGENGRELWVSDGTTAGTQLVADIYPGSDDNTYAYSSNASSLTVLNDELFFGANDGINGNELFKLTVDDSINIISGTNRSDILVGTEGADQIEGLNGKDILNGGGGNDTLLGGNSQDILVGGDGDDSLIGENGRDILDGGPGSDTLTGGLGRDIFILRSDEGEDTIVDFQLGTDLINLKGGVDFGALTFSGNTIEIGEEILVTLNGMNVEEFTESDFLTI